MQRSQAGPRLGAAALVSVGADGAQCRENQVFLARERAGLASPTAGMKPIDLGQ